MSSRDDSRQHLLPQSSKDDIEQALRGPLAQEHSRGGSQNGTMRRPTAQLLVTCLYFATNIFCTVAIVFLNKLTYMDEQLKHFQIATTVYHFAITFLVLFLASAGLPKTNRIFEPIYIPIQRMLSISLFFSAAVVLGHVRLAYCSVGFFQLSKILLTPCTALLNWILFRKTTSRTRLIAIVFCCIGTAMTNTKEAVANPFGTAIAVVSVIVASLYQIWIKKKMDDFQVTGAQLLLNQAPVSVLILICFLPFSSTMPDLNKIQTKALLAFLVSGLAAAGVNLSQFLIIGRTSPLTFTIVGVVKTMIIVVLAPLIDATTFTIVQISGIMLVTYGVWSYARGGISTSQKVDTVETESDLPLQAPNARISNELKRSNLHEEVDTSSDRIMVQEEKIIR